MSGLGKTTAGPEIEDRRVKPPLFCRGQDGNPHGRLQMKRERKDGKDIRKCPVCGAKVVVGLG